MFLRIAISTEQLRRLDYDLGPRTAAWGGFQRLIAALQQGIHLDPGRGLVCTMTPENAERVLMYSAASYGPGTYQTIIRCLAPEVERVLRVARPGWPGRPLALPLDDWDPGAGGALGA